MADVRYQLGNIFALHNEKIIFFASDKITNGRLLHYFNKCFFLKKQTCFSLFSIS